MGTYLQLQTLLILKQQYLPKCPKGPLGALKCYSAMLCLDVIALVACNAVRLSYERYLCSLVCEGNYIIFIACLRVLQFTT